jgi:hypothetical protein
MVRGGISYHVNAHESHFMNNEFISFLNHCRHQGAAIISALNVV